MKNITFRKKKSIFKYFFQSHYVQINWVWNSISKNTKFLVILGKTAWNKYQFFSQSHKFPFLKLIFSFTKFYFLVKHFLYDMIFTSGSKANIFFIIPLNSTSSHFVNKYLCFYYAYNWQIFAAYSHNYFSFTMMHTHSR